MVACGLSSGFALETAERIVDLSTWSDAPWAVDVVEALDRFQLVCSLQDLAEQIRRRVA